jgi:hypothetical protein
MAIKRVSEKMIYPFRSNFHKTETFELGEVITRDFAKTLWVSFTGAEEKAIRAKLCPSYATDPEGSSCPCRESSLRSGTDFFHPEYTKYQVVEFPAGGFAILHDPSLWQKAQKT